MVITSLPHVGEGQENQEIHQTEQLMTSSGLTEENDPLEYWEIKEALMFQDQMDFSFHQQESDQEATIFQDQMDSFFLLPQENVD